MSTPTTVKTPIAIEERTEMKFSDRHATTSNFYELSVARCMELVPDLGVDLRHITFTRLEPMNVPTFDNDAKMNNRVYFVPFRTIFPGWNDFITDSVHVNSDGVVSNIPHVHMIKNSEIVAFFMANAQSELIYENSAVDAFPQDLRVCDFVVTTLNNSEPYVRGYRLKPAAKRYLKTFMSLGYAINFDLTSEEIYHSAMPLLALAKVYYDWYYPQNYTQNQIAMQVQRWFVYDKSDFADVFAGQELEYFMPFIDKVNYKGDYYVSAWDNPVAPTTGSYSTLSITDPTTFSDSVATRSNGTPVVTMSNSGTGSFSFSQFVDTALHKLTDYMKRHQLAGARNIDRYLARFGITLAAEKLNRSIYIDSMSKPIDFGDVTSTSSTEGASLGQFAGKGIGLMGQNESGYSFNTDEYGILLVLSSIVTQPRYYQGQDRMTMHMTKFDFWTPEFDNLGVQALATREVYMPLNSFEQNSNGRYHGADYNKMVFGFVPRYGEYKRGVDRITGDYRLGSRNAGKDAWTLFRDLTPIVLASDGVAKFKHDENFVSSSDSNQYNRIFQYMNDDIDQFNIMHYFEITVRFPGKSLYDSYEWSIDEDKQKKVNLALNGSKAN